MFRDKREAEHAGSGARDLIPDVFLVGDKFQAELSADLDRFVRVSDDLDPSEHDDGPEREPPLAGIPDAFVQNTEGGLVRVADRVDLVPGLPAVEIQPAVFFAEPLTLSEFDGCSVFLKSGICRSSGISDSNGSVV